MLLVIGASKGSVIDHQQATSSVVLSSPAGVMQDVCVNLSVNFHRHQQHLAGAEWYVTAIDDWTCRRCCSRARRLGANSAHRRDGLVPLARMSQLTCRDATLCHLSARFSRGTSARPATFPHPSFMGSSCNLYSRLRRYIPEEG